MSLGNAKSLNYIGKDDRTYNHNKLTMLLGTQLQYIVIKHNILVMSFRSFKQLQPEGRQYQQYCFVLLWESSTRFNFVLNFLIISIHCTELEVWVLPLRLNAEAIVIIIGNLYQVTSGIEHRGHGNFPPSVAFLNRCILLVNPGSKHETVLHLQLVLH